MSSRKSLLVLICVAQSALAQGGDLKVRTLGASGDAAQVVCSRCADGDFLINNGKIEVVIGGSHRRDSSFYKFPTADALGSIVFHRPAGADASGDIMVGTPYVRVNNTTRHVRYRNLEIQRSENSVEVVANGLYSDGSGARAQFEGRYVIAEDSERVDISLRVTNVGSTSIENFIYSIFFDSHQIYDFSPADATAHRRLRFRGYPRAMHLTGWVDRTPRVPTTDDEWGWDGGMILPDPVAVTLEPGERDSREYGLFADREAHAVLRDIYREFGVKSQTVPFEFASESTEYFELVVRDADSSAIFFRAFLDRPAPIAIALPAGKYNARANFFPGVAECSLEVSGRGTSRCVLQDPPKGRASVRIVDSAEVRVPGKVTFQGSALTPTPYFRPENPAYDDGYWESVKNSVFPVNADKEIELPVGSYSVSASRGPEYSIDERTVRISKGKTEVLQFVIDRVLERPDLISMDSHLHTLESDGAVDVAEKVRAIVAEGIDVAVATDHNFPVDYRPVIEDLGLHDHLMALAGAEVTVPERLDYNSYPMTVQPDEPNHGAIDALSTDIGGRFEASRARDRGVVLQINHPRSWQFDYFNWHGLDPESAAFAYEGLDLSFDVLEVVNGAIYETPNNEATRNDWFNLLRRGYFFPLVGTSDSHEIDHDEPGYSRTWIYRGDPPDRPVNVDLLMQSVREGRSFASNGPILDLTVSGRYRPGDTVTAVNGIVEVEVDVWSAPWIEAGTVQIYINGVPQHAPAQPVPHPTATHLRAEVELQLDQDAFLVAEVRGTRDLFPVVQRRSAANGEETGVFPYALTNPVFVDVDGNGKFDAPLPNVIEIRPIDAEDGAAQFTLQR